VPCAHDHARIEEACHQPPGLLLPDVVCEFPCDRLEGGLGERETLGVAPLCSRAEQVPEHVERDLSLLVAEEPLLFRGRAEVGNTTSADAGQHVVERRGHGLRPRRSLR
jgi:hypothetical protein